MTDTTKNPHAHRHKFILGLTRLAALAFGLFIIAIVVIANRGEGVSWWSFIHRIPYADKISHIGLFGTLSFLCNLALPSFRLRFLPRCITPITLILLILISLEEISQAFIPTRHCDLFDWLADLAGLAIGQIAALRCTRRFNKETPPDGFHL